MWTITIRRVLTGLVLALSLFGCGDNTDGESAPFNTRGVGNSDGTFGQGGQPGTNAGGSADNPNESSAPNSQNEDADQESQEATTPLGGLNPEAQEEPEASGLSCLDIIACFGQCAEGDRACLDGCFAQGSPEGQSALQELSECYQTYGCQDQACADENCLWEQRVCESGGGSAADGPAGSDNGQTPEASANPSDGELTCNEIFRCYSECPRGDQGCIQGCADRGYASSRRAVDGIGACIRANECQDNNCVEQNCTAQIRICDGDDGRLDLYQPDGRDLTCSEIEDCFNTCAGTDERCLDRCYNSGSAQARETLSSVGACMRRNDCQSQACVDSQCGDIMQACAEDLPVVTNTPDSQGPTAEPTALACHEIVDCFNGCNGERSCMDVCFQSGDAESRESLNLLSQCLQDNECQDDACMQAHCLTEYQRCYAGVDTPSGPEDREGETETVGLDCVGVYQCSNQCPAGDRDCSRNCYERGTDQGRSEVDAVSSCVREAGCQDDDCARTACGDEINACETPDEEEPSRNEPNDNTDTPSQEAPNEDGSDEDGAPALPTGDELETEDPIDETPESDGSCMAPHRVELGEVDGYTGDGFGTLRGSCGGGGPEQVYELVVSSDMTICADTTGSAVDTVLYVREASCDAYQSEVGCNDDFRGVQSRLSFSADAETTYFVVVDTYNVSGNFTLSLSQGVCP